MDLPSVARAAWILAFELRTVYKYSINKSQKNRTPPKAVIATAK